MILYQPPEVAFSETMAPDGTVLTALAPVEADARIVCFEVARAVPAAFFSVVAGSFSTLEPVVSTEPEEPDEDPEEPDEEPDEPDDEPEEAVSSLAR